MESSQDYRETRPHEEPPRHERRRRPSYKSPALALILSFMPGLGQVYVGYYQRGFIHAAIFAVTVGLISAGFIEPVLGPFLGFFVLYNLIDAARRASLYNQALDGVPGVALPDETARPFRGSLAGGIVLIVLALLILLNTAFDYSLEWLEDWWPLAPLGLGIWLVVKARRNPAPPRA